MIYNKISSNQNHDDEKTITSNRHFSQGERRLSLEDGRLGGRLFEGEQFSRPISPLDYD